MVLEDWEYINIKLLWIEVNVFIYLYLYTLCIYLYLLYYILRSYRFILDNVYYEKVYRLVLRNILMNVARLGHHYSVQSFPTGNFDNICYCKYYLNLITGFSWSNK